MCQQCYIDAGEPKIINESVIEGAKLVKELYSHPDCNIGGYAHIATDDWNLEDGDIDWCIEEANKGELDHIDEDGRQLCLRCLRQLRLLTEDEGYTVLALVDGLITI